MLSLITTEQSGGALIKSTDATIRNRPRKDNVVARENAAVFNRTHTRVHTHTHKHTQGINRHQPGTAWRRAGILTGQVSIVTARWAEMTLIVGL